MFFSQLFDQFPDLNDLLRIESDRRLIQYNDFGIANDCLRKSDSLPVTFGEVSDQPVLHVHDLGKLHDLFDRGLSFVFWDLL